MFSAASPIWQLPNMLPIFLLLPVPFFLSPIYKRAECCWIRNPPPPSPLTISLFYFPYQRLRLIYSSSFACGLHLLEFKPYSTMMTRGKRSSTATASSTQVKHQRASSTSRPTKSKRPKQTSRVHSVPALNPPEVPYPSELSREPAISGPSSVSSPAAPSSVVSQDVVSSITSAISSAVLESLKSAGIIPQEPVQTSDPAAAVQASVAQVVQDLTGEGHTLISTSITNGPETDRVWIECEPASHASHASHTSEPCEPCEPSENLSTRTMKPYRFQNAQSVSNTFLNPFS